MASRIKNDLRGPVVLDVGSYPESPQRRSPSPEQGSKQIATSLEV